MSVEPATRLFEASRALILMEYGLELVNPVKVKVVPVPALIGVPQPPCAGGLAPEGQVTTTS